MLTPSPIFNTLRERPGNHITQKCVIEVGNYALSSKGAAATASSEFSADWPASAVVNGDRTHINAGAPNVAENGVGLGVWQGSAVADGSGNLSEWIKIDLGSVRRFNRIKLIFWPEETKNGNLGAIGPKDFIFYIGDDVTTGYGGGGFGGGGYGGPASSSLLIPWDGLVDKCAEIGKSPVSISGGVVTGNTNDMVVFEDPTPQEFQFLEIDISKLQAASVRTRIVAVELTLAVDVSDAVTASSRQRKKDYHLQRRQASLLQLSLRNSDGRFNNRVTPTAAQIAAGWFNPSIRPNLEVRYYAGFSGVNSQMFSGFIDSWTPDTGARVVKVQARDFFKFLIKPTISTGIKANKSLEFLVEFVANVQNFPSNLMLLDTTTISVGHFMPNGKSIQSVLSDLQDATGNGEIYMDEFGRLNFRSYLTIIKHIWFQGDESDFAAGTNINNTDYTSVPGALVLSNVAGVYAREGNWYSALSPVLDGKVEFTTFLAAISTGPSTSIDLFMRVTEDGGSTFTPWRSILPGDRGVISKWNQWYGQVQVWARLRTSDTTTTPQLLDFTVRYTSRGGSMMFSDTPDWATKDSTTLLGMRRQLTDSVGGVNYMVSKAIVKSSPTFLGGAPITAWQGTFNNQPISVSNPLTVPIGETVINVDFGETQYDVPQIVNLTLGTASATTALSSDPSKPTLTITATVPGTITGLTISGTPFVQSGAIVATSLAPQQIADDYGVNEDTLSNDYIDNVDQAQSIADNMILMFGNGPLDWITDGDVRFSPNAQINDRITVVDSFSQVNDDYVAIGFVDELSIGADKSFTAKTTPELVKIGAGVVRTVPAYFGGGAFYYGEFDNGGDSTLK